MGFVRLLIRDMLDRLLAVPGLVIPYPEADGQCRRYANSPRIISSEAPSAEIEPNGSLILGTGAPYAMIGGTSTALLYSGGATAIPSLVLDAGTVGAPSLSWSGSATTGLDRRDGGRVVPRGDRRGRRVRLYRVQFDR